MRPEPGLESDDAAPVAAGECLVLQCEPNGDFLIDPALLSGRLGIAAGPLRHRMRLGLVTSLVETGTGADEGLRRLTVRSGSRAWRALVDEQGRVVSEERLDLAAPPAPLSPT